LVVTAHLKKLFEVKMKLRYASLLTLLLFPTLAFASIAGKYKFKGESGSGVPYSGIATIVKAGENVFEARWVYSDGSFDVGTAVLKDNNLSFVFANVIGQEFGDRGVISYEIKGHTLKGTYVYFAKTSVGHEKMKKICHE
jgi:hypothetical protein